MSKDAAFNAQRYIDADKLREDKLAPLMDSINNGRAGAKQVGELLAEYQALKERQSRHGRIWRFFHKNENLLRNELMNEMRRTVEDFLGEKHGVDLDTVDPAKLAIWCAETQIRKDINEAITLRETDIEKAYGVENNSAPEPNKDAVREHMPLNDEFSLLGEVDSKQISQPIIPEEKAPAVGDDAKTNEFTLLN